MTLYLIETTLVLAIGLAASRLPRLAARTRFAIVFVALLKCAFPSALLHDLGVTPAQGRITITGRVGHVLAPAMATQRAIWPDVALAAWLAIVVLLFARTLWLAHRAYRAALADALPASARERAALPLDVELLRSPFAAAPAALGIFRPRIVLPLDGGDALDDDELASVLAHECAHVARRDNLLALVEALIGSTLWFHPLVWLARRELARTRESACDDAALRGSTPEIYLHALTKLARGAIAPHFPAVSCMAAANLKERMSLIMRSPSLRPLSHRLVTAFAIVAVAAMTLGAGAVRAADDAKAPAYKLNFSVTPEGDRVAIEALVSDAKDNPVTHLKAATPRGVDTSARNGDFVIDFTWAKDGALTGTLRSTKDHAVLSTVSYKAVQKAFSGDPISINLRNADIHDVLKTFGTLTGLKFVVDENIQASVSINVKDMPWDEALNKIVTDAGLRLQREGDGFRVTK